MACFRRFSKIWSSHRRFGASGKLDWLSTPPGSVEDSPASAVFTLRTPRNLARSSADAFLEAYSFGGALRHTAQRTDVRGHGARSPTAPRVRIANHVRSVRRDALGHLPWECRRGQDGICPIVGQIARRPTGSKEGLTTRNDRLGLLTDLERCALTRQHRRPAIGALAGKIGMRLRADSVARHARSAAEARVLAQHGGRPPRRRRRIEHVGCDTVAHVGRCLQVAHVAVGDGLLLVGEGLVGLRMTVAQMITPWQQVIQKGSVRTPARRRAGGRRQRCCRRGLNGRGLNGSRLSGRGRLRRSSGRRRLELASHPSGVRRWQVENARGLGGRARRLDGRARRHRAANIARANVDHARAAHAGGRPRSNRLNSHADSWCAGPGAL